MRTFVFSLSIIGILLFAGGCRREDHTIRLKFSSEKEMPGYKIALKDLCDSLPADWTNYNYAVLELKCSTSQRVFVGFTTRTGYNELRLIFYATNGWLRCALPLSYFRDLPSGAFDLAATYNHKRPLSFINIEHGERHPLVGVDSIGFRLHNPINNPTVEIRSFALSVNDPGDQYLENRPAVDQFGQWALGEFDGKAHSEEELQEAWERENEALATAAPYPVSKYGGDLSRKVKATGFFRTEKINGKWWFVDPEGYLFLSLGANCMRAGGGFVSSIVPGIYEENMPEGFVMPQQSRFPKFIPYGLWNLYRRWGEKSLDKANQMVMDRMDNWGLNTIGNWSDRNLIALHRKPFMLMLRKLGVEDGILGLPDVYEKDFVKKNREAVKAVAAQYKDDPMLIGYFFGNEPTWSHNEMRLCDLILEEKDTRPLKIAFKKFIEGNDTPRRRKEFVYRTFRKYLEITTESLKAADPNHLSLGIRFGSGIPSEEVLEACKDYFDVYSFNKYGLIPDMKDIDYIAGKIDLPMIIGEYHFGTVDRGLGMSLVQLNSQEERGIAYRHYTEQAFSHPSIVGTSYFQWNDQEILGRMDGENYNIGLVDVTDRPYPHMVNAIQSVARNYYPVHAGERTPYCHLLTRAAIAGDFPDKWE